MGAKTYYCSMALLFFSFVMLIVSYANDDGNLKFKLAFSITEPNEIWMELKHTTLGYGVNDDEWDISYSSMDLVQVFDHIFDSGSLKPDITAQLVAITDNYKTDLVNDVNTGSGASLPQNQKDQIISYVDDFDPNYGPSIEDIMADLSFANDLGITQDTNDHFAYFLIPSYLVVGGMVLCILSMIMLTMMYMEKIPESCCCKCCISFWCFFPTLVLMIACGATWIALVQVRDSMGEIDYDSAENSFRVGVKDVMNEFVTDPMGQYAQDNGINYSGFGTVLDPIIDGMGHFSDELTVGSSPYLQCIAGLVFLVFACGFCCCRNKKDDDMGGGEVEFGTEMGSNNYP